MAIYYNTPETLIQEEENRKAELRTAIDKLCNKPIKYNLLDVAIHTNADHQIVQKLQEQDCEKKGCSGYYYYGYDKERYYYPVYYQVISRNTDVLSVPFNELCDMFLELYDEYKLYEDYGMGDLYNTLSRQHKEIRIAARKCGVRFFRGITLVIPTSYIKALREFCGHGCISMNDNHDLHELAAKLRKCNSDYSDDNFIVSWYRQTLPHLYGYLTIYVSLYRLIYASYYPEKNINCVDVSVLSDQFDRVTYVQSGEEKRTKAMGIAVGLITLYAFPQLASVIVNWITDVTGGTSIFGAFVVVLSVFAISAVIVFSIVRAIGVKVLSWLNKEAERNSIC